MKRLMNYGEFSLHVAEKFGGMKEIENNEEKTRQFLRERALGWDYYQRGAIDAADDMRVAQPDVRSFFRWQNEIVNQL